jgi:hypothetical protein
MRNKLGVEGRGKQLVGRDGTKGQCKLDSSGSEEGPQATDSEHSGSVKFKKFD